MAFFGTPAYAQPALQALADDDRFDVRLVVTQPDRPAGRGRHLTTPPVKDLALELGLEVYQPASLRSVEARQPLVDADVDVFVVAAFGLIFGPKTLAIPSAGCINLHASLLPAYRGASPVTAAVLAGDETTGVSLMVMEAGLDTGPMISTVEVPIADSDTTGTLTAKLAEAGARLLVRDLPAWIAGDISPTPQAGIASFVRPLLKADGWIEWSQPADQIARRVRAMQPWPRAWTTTSNGLQMQLLEVRVDSTRSGMPGGVEVEGKTVWVGTGDGSIELVLAQLAGSNSMPGALLAQGRRIADGDLLGIEGVPDLPSPYLVEVPAQG